MRCQNCGTPIVLINSSNGYCECSTWDCSTERPKFIKSFHEYKKLNSREFNVNNVICRFLFAIANMPESIENNV